MISRAKLREAARRAAFGADGAGRMASFNGPVLARFGNPAHMGDTLRIDAGEIIVTTTKGRWRYLVVDQDDKTGEAVAVLVEKWALTPEPVEFGN